MRKPRGPQRCHLSLGRGQGIFYHQGLSLEGAGRACGRGGSAAPRSPPAGAAAYQPVPAAGSGDFKGVSKALSLFLGTREGTDWLRPQLWLIQLFFFSTSTCRHLPFWGELSQVSWVMAGSLVPNERLWSQSANGTGWPCPAAGLCAPPFNSQPP